MSSGTEHFSENKTWRFLLPCLRGHGETFVKKFNPVLKQVGIYDESLEEEIPGRNIFILCDANYNPQLFSDFLSWIRYQSYYVKDYKYGITMSKVMVVISIPEQYYDAYDMFLKGKYSRMYSQKDINLLFSIPSRQREYNIITQNETYAVDFIKQLNKEFDTELTISDFGELEELEFPLKLVEEVFNHKDTDRVYFAEELDKVWS